MSCTGLIFRRPVPADHERVSAVISDWWSGRDPRPLLPRVFFEHFRATSVIAEHEDRLVGFLIGFPCPDHPDEAYVHLAGVHPAWRRAGLGSDLYRRFCALARQRGRTVVHAVAASVDDASVAFHTALGFTVLPADADADVGGVHVSAAPAPDGDRLVRLELVLAPEGGT